jgi:SAM-dependent methyltransferase
MLERQFGGLLPGPLRRRLMIVETVIEHEVRTFASSIPSNGRVLDAGAGEGKHAEYFRHCRYTGVDLAVGSPDWDYSGLESLADLSAMPFPDGTFRGAVNIVVLEHTREPARVLAEISRVLEPGGRLLLIVPHEWEVHQSPHDYFRFTRHGMAWLLSQSGLTASEIRPIGGYFTLLARRLLNALNFFQGGLRWVLFPFVAVTSGVLAVILPSLDFLDTEKNFTLGYVCIAEKPL